jgi:hypothetical protein
MSDVLPPLPQHAFSHAPAALRIFRFAADTAPRVLEIAHVNTFLRECAVEFGSADATLPAAMRNECAAGRYFTLRAVVERNAARCPWLAAKVLACRSGAPVPAAALAPDVTRHDVNWGAEGARRHQQLRLTHDGFGLSRDAAQGYSYVWAQGPVGVTSGKHFFSVSFANCEGHSFEVGWVDANLSVADADSVGWSQTQAAGAAWYGCGALYFGTPPNDGTQYIKAAKCDGMSCTVGALLDLEATPRRMHVWINGEPLAVECPYDFPPTHGPWRPSVCVANGGYAMFSDAQTC